MRPPRYRYVFLGLSITSSWGNRHAATYRALLRQLAARGHQITFLERGMDVYAAKRDMPNPAFARTFLYESLEDLFDRFTTTLREADVVVVGSHVPHGAAVGAWAQEVARGRTAFYDMDTPVTLAKLAEGGAEYLEASQVPRYALYLSSVGGPTLGVLEERYRAPCARPLYRAVDPDLYFPEATEVRWDIGYLGTYSPDRQPALDRLLLEPARRWTDGRFVVAGHHCPDDEARPSNVDRETHLGQGSRRKFYNAQRFTLNVTRAERVKAGCSPSARLFEAAACGTPIISDRWPGLETILEPGREVLIADSTEQALAWLRDMPETERSAIGQAARRRVLAEHTAMHRAESLERATRELFERLAKKSRDTRPSWRDDQWKINP